MEEFVKKYSSMPNSFIEDFFDIAKESYNDNELSIDLNLVAKWLNVDKNNLKRLLKNFTIDYDYIINKTKVVSNTGATYIQDIWITPDCFKRLCMLSKTSRADKVRSYYLSIEKLIRKYHHYIEEKLQKKIKLLEANQKPKVNIEGGVVYFFKALNQIDDEDLYKLGKTTNKKNRFNTYNSGNANDIEPLFIIEVDDIDTVEGCIKNILKKYQYRKYKEIYKISVDALKMVFVNCDDLVRGFKKYMKNNGQKMLKVNAKKMRHSKYGLILSFQKNK